ncbi:MAG: hypothetical protein HYW25_05200 [Candidatus Aenigmarchaeota archaeon]|nr:hypothetical protein [Candidatus Aenigmarchaeota archaeon]
MVSGALDQVMLILIGIGHPVIAAASIGLGILVLILVGHSLVFRRHRFEEKTLMIVIIAALLLILIGISGFYFYGV